MLRNLLNHIGVLSFTELAITFSVLFFSIFLIVCRKKIERFFVSIFDAVFRGLKSKIKIFTEKFDKSEIARDLQIHDILTETRVKTGADRAYIFQFHNGSVFNTNNPIWRLSVTHESVLVGTSSEVSKLTNMFCSHAADLLQCLWGEVKTNGIKLISTEWCRCNGVYLIDVESMDAGYSKSRLQARGIKYFIITAIIDRKGDIIGKMCIDFCNNLESFKERNLCILAKDLCDASSKISYLLLSDKN